MSDRNQLSLGSLIKRRRSRLDVSLDILSKTSGISIGYLSQIECDNVMPTLGTLAQISQALNVTVDYFVPVPEAASGLSRAKARETFSLKGSECFYEALSSNIPGAQLSSFIIHVPPFHRSETAKHDGEEIMFVLEGELIQTLGEESIIMKKGDNIHYNGNTPHSWSNPTDTTTVLLWTGTLKLFQTSAH